MDAVRRLAQANILLAGCTFLTGIVLAHALGPEGRGKLAILVLWPTVLSPLALLGMHLHLARQTAGNPAHALGNYRLGFRAIFFSASGVMLVYGLVVWLGAKNFGAQIDIQLAIFAALVIPPGMWCAFLQQMELGRQNTSTFIFIRYSFVLSHLFLVASLWFSGMRTVVFYLSAFVIANGLAAGASHLRIIRTLPPPDPARRPERTDPTFFNLLSASRPYGYSVALTAIASAVDRMMVSLFFDPKTMGLYVVALVIAQLQSVLGEAISLSFFAKVAPTRQLADVDQLWLALRLRQTIAIYIALTGALMICGAPAIRLVFGAKFDGSVDLLYLLLPSFALLSARRPFEEVLKAGGLPLIQARISLITTVTFSIFGSVFAWVGNISLMLTALFLSLLLGFILIVRKVAIEIDVEVGKLVFPRPNDLIVLAKQINHALRG